MTISYVFVYLLGFLVNSTSHLTPGKVKKQNKQTIADWNKRRYKPFLRNVCFSVIQPRNIYTVRVAELLTHY